MVTETKERGRKEDSRVWGMQLLHPPGAASSGAESHQPHRMDGDNRVGSREITADLAGRCLHTEVWNWLRKAEPGLLWAGGSTLCSALPCRGDRAVAGLKQGLHPPRALHIKYLLCCVSSLSWMGKAT